MSEAKKIGWTVLACFSVVALCAYVVLSSLVNFALGMLAGGRFLASLIAALVAVCAVAAFFISSAVQEAILHFVVAAYFYAALIAGIVLH